MSWQADIQSHLAAESGITDLVGTNIYADVADGSSTAPFLVWQVISTGGETTHDGAREVEFPTIQISCYAATKAGAIALGDAVDTALDGQSASGSSGISFAFSNRLSTYESDTKLYGEILEYRAATNTN